MPNPVNRRRKEQWDLCDRCGLLFPISQLSRQKGLMVDKRCQDTLATERHSLEVMKALSIGAEHEGVDRRSIDMAFFVGHDEEVV